MEKEFKKLQKENDKLREKMDRILNYAFFKGLDREKMWEDINKLIENEIEQEKFCNQ